MNQIDQGLPAYPDGSGIRSMLSAMRGEHGVRLCQLFLLPILLAAWTPAGAFAAARADDRAAIARGEHLARAGDCVACCTIPDGVLFAGGRPMPTAFGTLYSSNITPDPEAGVGRWNAKRFYGIMHFGRFPGGGQLDPAMPFGSHTKVTRADSDAIFAYLGSVPAVRQRSVRVWSIRPDK